MNLDPNQGQQPPADPNQPALLAPPVQPQPQVAQDALMQMMSHIAQLLQQNNAAINNMANTMQQQQAQQPAPPNPPPAQIPQPAPQLPQPMQVVQTPFAVTPGTAAVGQLDYNTTSHAKLFHKATEPLTTIFDTETPNIKVFIQELRARAAVFGWEGIMDVMVHGTS